MSRRIVRKLGARGPWTLPVALLPVMLATAVGAQMTVEVRSSAVFESYEFSEGLDFDRASEISLPLTATARFGRRGTLTIATGFASVDIESAGREASTVSGVLDTEFRLAYQTVRDRLTLFTTASLPTGIGAIDRGDVSTLAVLASDVIGFSTVNLGTGGSVGGGVALTAPAGDMAFGAAVSFRAGSAYQPVRGVGTDFKPGGEFRLRLGLEGPVARRSFLRVAGIFAHRSEDELDGDPTSAVGDRISAYISLDQGVGSSTLTLYVFDLYRSASGLGQTAVGTSELPRGNILAAGAQWSFTLARGTSLTPRVEVRESRAEDVAQSGGLERLGSTARIGVALRHQISQTLAGVVQLGGLRGSLVSDGKDIDVSGYRISAHLEIIP